MLWIVREGSGGLCNALGGPREINRALAGFEGLWRLESSGGFEGPWMFLGALEGSEWLWKALKDSGGLSRALAGSGLNSFGGLWRFGEL